MASTFALFACFFFLGNVYHMNLGFGFKNHKCHSHKCVNFV